MAVHEIDITDPRAIAERMLELDDEALVRFVTHGPHLVRRALTAITTPGGLHSGERNG